MQSPGGLKEDPTGDFQFGGWVMPYYNEQFGAEVDRLFTDFDLLLGRKTYEIFAAYWPYYEPDAPHGGIASAFKSIRKYVVSRSGDVDTGWAGSVLLRDIAAVKRLKEEDGPSLVTQGSTELVHALLVKRHRRPTSHQSGNDIVKIHPYLNFDGKTEEAFRFYEKVLGGKLTEMHRFGSMPQDGGFELTPEQKKMVMHVGLELPGGQMIMASDMLEGMGPKRIEGNNYSISIHPDSRQQADEIFSALAEGGTIIMPIEDQFWGDYYGALTDRFGVNWMVNYSEQAG